MIFAWLLACGSPDTAPDEPVEDAAGLSAVQAGLVDGFVVPTAEAYVAGADAMVTAVQGLCAAPSAETLASAQASWLAARRPWKKLEVVNFGPDVEEPYRIGPKLDFWPGRPSSIETLLAGDGAVDAAAVDVMGGATRGLPALEILLFRTTDGGAAPLDALADPRRCAYAVGLAQDAAALGRRYIAAWNDAWRARLVDPVNTAGDAYDRHQDVLDEWVNRMAFTVEDLRFVRLGKPLGDTSGGTPLPDTLESRYSGASLRDVADVLDGVDLVFEGADGKPGIASLLPEGSPIRSAFVQRVGLTRDALMVVPEPLELAVTEAPESVVVVQDQLRELQVIVQVSLAQALSVTVVFNDNDGD